MVCCVVNETLAPFIGTWRLEREIENYREDSHARFEGAAMLTPEAGGLVYVEEGQWVSDGLLGLSGERRYRWESREDGQISVLFEDGRFFHAFALGAAAEAAHFCDPDQYDVAYSFDLPQCWTANWRVRGPRKDYVSQTTYRRGL